MKHQGFVLSLLSVCLLALAFTCSINAQTGQAQDYAGTTIDGREISLEKDKGKVIVLTFWSTSCIICKSEMPKLNKIIDKNQANNVVFYGLTHESNLQKINGYLAKNKVKFTVVPNSFGALLKYAHKNADGTIDMGFPSTFIIDQSGNLVYSGSGYSKTGKIDQVVSSLLGSR